MREGSLEMQGLTCKGCVEYLRGSMSYSDLGYRGGVRLRTTDEGARMLVKDGRSSSGDILGR